MDLAYLDAIKEEAITKAFSAQPWSNYYALRKEQFVAILSQVDIGHRERALDIGCGNAFISALLSKNTDYIMATDLFSKHGIHSSMYSLDRAKQVIEKLDIKNCKILSSRAEHLPFKSKSFDLIYCQYTLQYINDKDKRKAVGEIARVLKRDGIAIIVVPNFTQALFIPFYFYTELVKKLMKHIAKKVFSVLSTKNNNLINRNIQFHRYKDFKEFKTKHPHFPFPEPCGCYRNIIDQLFKETPFYWKQIIRGNNLVIKKVISPLLPLWQPLGFILPSLRLKMYKKSIRAIKFFNSIPVLKFLGDTLCFVVENK